MVFDGKEGLEYKSEEMQLEGVFEGITTCD